MPTYGPLTASVLGMKTQSNAFSSISQNITNLNTGGHKATEARFSTVLASTYDTNRDVGGVQSVFKTNVSVQGRTIATTNKLDLAINGQGLFVLNSSVSGAGDTFYSRDGAFQVQNEGTTTATVEGQSVTADTSYLVDKNGNYLMGLEPDVSGNFDVTGTMVPIRVDQNAFSSANQASTTASIALNLPGGTGESQTAFGSIFTAGLTDSNGDLIQGSNVKQLQFDWDQASTNNSWTLTVSSPGGAAPEDDPSTSTLSQTFNFDSSGRLPDGTTFSFTMPWADGQTSSTVDLDLSDVTAIGDDFIYFDFQKNGRNEGELAEYNFDDKGNVVGRFSNGEVRNLYRLPLAIFPNADALSQVSGNRFTTSAESGTPIHRFADIEGFATFSPFAHELSNTNLQNEFTRMIMVQQAYNMSATVFTTVDEMTQTASNLKA